MAKSSPILMPRRRPIIRIGQSNTKYAKPIADYPVRLQSPQDPIRAHYAAPGLPVTVDDPTFRRVGPWGPGNAYGDYGLDLADALFGLGESVALIEYCVGNTPLSYWTPGLTDSQYPTISAWIKARYDELPSPLAPILIMHQSESGAGYGGTWDQNMTTAAAAYRSLFSAPTMGIIVVQNAPNSGMGVAFIPYQQTYVASDSRSRMAYFTAPTYDDTDLPHSVHWDAVSARKLAVGPDSPGTVRSIVTCFKELTT